MVKTSVLTAIFVLVPTLAYAETTGEPPDPTTGGGETSTGEDDGSSDDASDEGCGSCSDPGESVVFESPADGATVGSQFTVAVLATYSCSCDVCGCFEDGPSAVSLYVNDEFLATAECGDSCEGTQIIDVLLEPGTYELRAEQYFSFHAESATIQVTVTADDEGSDGSEGSDGASDPGADLDGDKTGCACTANGSDTAPAGLMAMLLALGVTRRRA